MNILYIWIKKYGIIKNQGFVTTTEYNIKGELTIDSGEVSKEKLSLHIEKNDNYIKDFFKLNKSPRNNVRITDITAIIGENGAGKSTFLNFIKNNIVDGAGGIQIPAVVILKDGERRIIYHHKSINIDLNENSIEFEKIEYDSDLDLLHLEQCRNTSFIFYSNIFDYVGWEEEWGENYNISTNYLIQNDKKDAVEMDYYDTSISEVTAFRYKEIKRQIDFVNYYKESVKFKLPDKVAITINNFMLSRAVLKNQMDAVFNNNNGYNDFDDKDTTKYDEHYPLIRYVYQQLRILRLKPNGDAMRLKCIWHMAIFNAFFHNYNLILNQPVKLNDILIECGIINDSVSSSYFNSKDFEHANIIEKVLMFFQKLLLAYKLKKVDYAVRWIEKIISIINLINKAIDENKYSPYSNSIILETDDSELSIAKFIEAYDTAFSLRPLVNFNWLDMSSGEKAQLSMFSRFFSIVKSENKSLKDNIIVLIDEGELYYHPQWQKEFIKGLIDLLEKIYGENNKKRNIQVILTSNSPFVASDLPTKNIIFLKKEKGTCKVVNGLEENIYTFGANIHTLLSDSFFMRGGLMGSFAKEKIDSIVKSLLSDTNTQVKEKIQEIEATISIIGEPLIRNKLHKLLRDRILQEIEHNIEYDKLFERVKLLEMEIEVLKKGQVNRFQ